MTEVILKKSIFSAAIILFLVSLFVYNINLRVLTCDDNVPTRFLALRIVKDKSLFLDRMFLPGDAIPKTIYPLHPSIRAKSGHIVAEKSTGMALFSAPLFSIVYRLTADKNVPQDPASPAFKHQLDVAEKITSSVIAALSVAMLFFLLIELETSLISSVLISCIYAFGSSHWSVSSQGLWVHTGVEFWLTAALLAIVVYERSKRIMVLYIGSFATGMLFLIRPTGLFYIAAILLYIYKNHRNDIVKFLLFPSILITFYATFNLVALGSLMGGYADVRPKPFWEFGFRQNMLAALGMFWSPGRGLFFYTPVMAFSFYGMYLALRARQEISRLLIYMIPAISLITFLHTVYSDNSTYLKWYGGGCYGPRYFVDIMPVLAVFLSVCFRELSLMKDQKKKIIFYAIVSFLVSWSVFTQVVGTFFYKGAWHEFVGGVDNHPESVWDLANNPVKIEFMSRNDITPPYWTAADLYTSIPTKPTAPLNRSDYKASIVLSNSATTTLAAGSVREFKVKIKNLGNATFPSSASDEGKYVVNLSYHLLNKDGSMYTFDGARVSLLQDIRPGKELSLMVPVVVPRNPGDYTIEFDLVAEDVTWFKDQGSETLNIAIHVVN